MSKHVLQTNTAPIAWLNLLIFYWLQSKDLLSILLLKIISLCGTEPLRARQWTNTPPHERFYIAALSIILSLEFASGYLALTA